MNIFLRNQETLIVLFLRYALALAFLSAVADRFGLWGNVGDTGIAWGNFDAFILYVQYLNPYLPQILLSSVSWAVTLLEVLLGLLLIFGFMLRQTALISAIMLLVFALAMSFNIGVKAPLDYSVYTASAASFLLYIRSKVLV